MQGIKKDSDENQKGFVAVYAITMALGTFLSRILGLVRDQLFAAFFSATVRDAWTAAFRIPNLFRRLLGEGSLSVNFIPVFIEEKINDPSGVSAQNLVNSFYTLLLILLTALTTLGVLFPEFFLNLILDPEYSSIPGKFEMTVRMTRIMFCFIFFMSTYAYFMGILNALGRFGLPAMAPLFFNVAMIVSNFVPQEVLTMPGDAIAWGVVVGGFLQTIVLVPALKKAGYLPQLSKTLFHPKVKIILRNMLPGMLGLGLLQITTVVNMRFASSLGEGPITYIYLADRLLELPLSLVSVSLGTALLPTLSGFWARKDYQKFQETIEYYFGLNLYIAIPAALGLGFLAFPIVSLLFQRGLFSIFDTQKTALVVQVYSFILITSSCVRVLVPTFYAIKNTWVPAAVSGVALIIHVLVAPILMERFGLGGLVGSSFVSGFVNLFLLFVFYRSQIGQFSLMGLLKKIFKFIVPASGMTAVLYFQSQIESFFNHVIYLSMPSLTVSATGGRIASLAAVIILSGTVYFLISYWMKLEEFQQTSQMVWSKVKRRLKR